jgi:hypothetical protein
MLVSHNQHLWSRDGVEWFQPEYGQHAHFYGGSAAQWVGTKVEGDARVYLSQWGHDVEEGSYTGGCCSSSTFKHMTFPDSNDPGRAWGQPFTFGFGLALQPPPENTGVSLLVAVGSTTTTNGKFWENECKGIAGNTVWLMLDMGTVRARCPFWVIRDPYALEDTVGSPTFSFKVSMRLKSNALGCSPSLTGATVNPVQTLKDFYRPKEKGVSFCTMLQSHDQHVWSADGVDWVEPKYHEYPNFFGGSFAGWPKENVGGDERTQLSYWGYAVKDESVEWSGVRFLLCMCARAFVFTWEMGGGVAPTSPATSTSCIHEHSVLTGFLLPSSSPLENCTPHPRDAAGLLLLWKIMVVEQGLLVDGGSLSPFHTEFCLTPLPLLAAPPPAPPPHLLRSLFLRLPPPTFQLPPQLAAAQAAPMTLQPRPLPRSLH